AREPQGKRVGYASSWLQSLKSWSLRKSRGDSVTQPDDAELSGQLVLFYAAITTSEDEALAIVRRAVKADAAVEPTGGRLSQQTASALVLEAGLARAL
ncbi:hypothetical protein, partial [Methylobacterium sp. 1030]|uniref:hypothetical protein n=1 Tax=Methylobacterium sp. 1030 TaxID=3156404 RepID=UPI0033958623